jgi:hypothetical protein
MEMLLASAVAELERTERNGRGLWLLKIETKTVLRALRSRLIQKRRTLRNGLVSSLFLHNHYGHTMAALFFQRAYDSPRSGANVVLSMVLLLSFSETSQDMVHNWKKCGDPII